MRRHAVHILRELIGGQRYDSQGLSRRRGAHDRLRANIPAGARKFMACPLTTPKLSQFVGLQKGLRCLLAPSGPFDNDQRRPRSKSV
jgi:hypothetical protein